MADYRRQHDDTPRRLEHGQPDRASDEVRSWFGDGSAPWEPRERGGYWRQFESARQDFVGRGPKGYQRSDDRIRDEVCDRMTEDRMLDASEIVVDVRQGEVMLSGSVTSRDQSRRAEDVAERISGVRDVANQLRVTRDENGHNWAPDSSRASGPGMTPSQPVNGASGKGTPGKTTSRTSA